MKISKTLQIKDETAIGKVYNAIDVVFSNEMVTVKGIRFLLLFVGNFAELQQYNMKWISSCFIASIAR